MSTEPQNLKFDAETIELFVWVDPDSHNMNVVGQFCSMPHTEATKLLPFLPNPEYKDVFVSPFSSGIMRPYIAESNLELARSGRFANYPSRLSAIFLLPTEAEAMKYRDRYPNHVGNRVLKSAKSKGQYLFSRHDASWIDFLRAAHSLDDETITSVANAYWQGLNAESCELQSCGKAWTSTPITEILYLGNIEFKEPSVSSTATPNS